MKVLTLRVRLELSFTVTEAVALVRGGRLVEIRADNPKVHAVLTVNREEIASRDGRLVLGGRLLFPNPRGPGRSGPHHPAGLAPPSGRSGP